MKYNSNSVKKASERSSQFHVADFDGVWDSLPNVRMLAKVIVTGRSYEEALVTFAQIRDLHVMKAVPIYFNPVKAGVPNLDNISAWKSEMIKKLGATDFWEDDPEQIKIMEVSCPGVTFHLVNSKYGKED